jgi:hypothetical protein
MFTESRRRGPKRLAHTPIPKALSLCFVHGERHATDRKVLQPSRGLLYRFLALLFTRYKKIPFQQRQHNIWAVWRCLSLLFDWRPALSVDRSPSYHIGGSNERERARSHAVSLSLFCRLIVWLKRRMVVVVVGLARVKD